MWCDICLAFFGQILARKDCITSWMLPADSMIPTKQLFFRSAIVAALPKTCVFFHSNEHLPPEVLDLDGVASVVKKKTDHDQGHSLVWTGPQWAGPLAVVDWFWMQTILMSCGCCRSWHSRWGEYLVRMAMPTDSGCKGFLGLCLN